MSEHISQRLMETLAHYADVEDAEGREDLGRIVRSGGLPWFVEEFEEAIRAHAFTPQLWGRITYSGIEDDEDWTFVDDDLREIWHQVAAGRTYPYDEPDTDPPPGWADRPNADGVSQRLAFTLTRYLRDAREDVRPEPANLPVELFRRAVAGGEWSWLPLVLEHALSSGALTPQVWGKLVYGDPNADPDLAEQDKRRLWQAVAPGRPYPGDAPG